MVSKQSFTQFTVNKRNQLMRLTLDWPNSFFKSEPAQLDSSGQTKLFMIILELSTSLFCSLPIIIKNFFYMTKTKILTRDNSMHQVLFDFSRSRAILRVLVSIKNLGQYKKFPCDKFVKKKNILKSIPQYAKFLLELQCLTDDLVYLELSVFLNFLYLKNISFNEVGRGFGHGKNTIYIIFSKKTLTDDLN